MDMFYSSYQDGLLQANGIQDLLFDEEKLQVEGSPLDSGDDYPSEFTDTFHLIDQDSPSALSVDPSSFSSSFFNEPEVTYPNNNFEADTSSQSDISEYPHRALDSQEQAQAQVQSTTMMMMASSHDEPFAGEFDFFGDNSTLDVETNEVQHPHAPATVPVTVPVPPARQALTGKGIFVMFSQQHKHQQDQEPSTPSYHLDDDEPTENNTATDSVEDFEEEEEDTVDHNEMIIVDNNNNELEEDDDVGVVPVNVFGAFDPNSEPNKQLLEQEAKKRITTYSKAKRAGILKKRRFLVAGRLRSILGMATMRHETDIAFADLSDFDKVALQAACLTCRNRRSLFEGREAKKQSAAVVKTPGRPGRKPKLVINQDTPATGRIHKTTNY